MQNDLVSMSPSNFNSMFKSIVLQLKQCGIEKKDEQIELVILSTLGLDYSVFLLTFHVTKMAVQNWKMPSLVYFMQSLTQEQDKLVMMGTIKPSKDQDLVVGDSKMGSKGKKKSNPKNAPDQKKDKSKSHEES